MSLTVALLMTAGFIPAAGLWMISAHSTIRHPLAWATLTWTVACRTAFTGDAVGHYATLCGVVCAGIAVLGARRPGVWAWHAVVGCLACVLAMPVVWGWGSVKLSTETTLFLSGLLAVACGNYLGTRLMPGALLVAGYGSLTLLQSAGVITPLADYRGALLIPVPWLTWLALRGPRPASCDGDWRRFRDRFGVMWAQRVREQFQRSAEHAGLAGELTWVGLTPRPSEETELRCRELLRALISRFEGRGH